MNVFGAAQQRRRVVAWALGIGVAATILAAGVLYFELARGSRLQAFVFTRIAQDAGYRVEPGASSSIRFPTHGPFDERMGYAQLPVFVQRLQERGCTVAEQARWSPRLAAIADWGLYPPYREPTQVGMQVLDRHAATLWGRRYPEHTYARFDDIPALVVETLLFVENRELLDDRFPQRNPAVEVNRLARATLDRVIHTVDPAHGSPGASTLATQLEKYRHSRDGRTESVSDKLRQMLSASLRAYQDGSDTRARRKQIILDYVNTVPLAARAPWGEVHGLGDALWVYYGFDLGEVNRALTGADDPASLAVKARAYKAILSLIVAQRRPAALLAASNEQLDVLVKRYAHMLADAGIISAELRDATLAAPYRRRPLPEDDVLADFSRRKGIESIRTHLSDWLGVARRYDLDRLDVTIASTLDARAQHDIMAALRQLNTPAGAKAAGLLGERMLARGDPSRMVYSVTLYDIHDQTFRLLVQADNLAQPFDANEGLKLDLGSTAKLRTLVTYLELVGELHQRLSALDAPALRAYPADPKDVLTNWARDYLLQARDHGLAAMLEAALQRRYSAHAGERFFTGGGMHSFQNFRAEDDARVLSVQEAFRDSVNLVFIRLMRDIVRHYIYRDGEGAVLTDRADPRRAAYLDRFIERESTQFLLRFFNEHRALDAGARAARLVRRHQPSAAGFAAIFRTIAPNDYEAAYRAFYDARHGAHGALPAPAKVPFDRYAPEKLSLNDRAYVAGVHPLELWLVAYLNQHPNATIAQARAASSEARREAYQWLLRGRNAQAQERALRTMLELDAFEKIYRAWQRLGYPFDSLVPSYASAVGASADRPAALALLMGIILADGARLPVTRVSDVHFAANTPYETRLRCEPRGVEQVLTPAVARALRKALVDVTERGTAARVKGRILADVYPAVVVGGKTGTGDHRYKTYAADGTLRQSRPVSRAGTFVFFVGERLFGVVTAYVAGTDSAHYQFTSALPLQVLAHIEPNLRSLLAPTQEPIAMTRDRVFARQGK